MPSLRLSVLIPGLAPSQFFSHPLATLPSLPWFEKILGRAEVSLISARGPEETLCQLAGINDGLPIAPLALLGDGGVPDNAWWLRADLVHLRPDQGKLLLFPGRSLHVKEPELIQLVAELEPVFAQWGCQFIAKAPDRWYLRLAENPHITTTPLSQVIGQDIARALPQGPGAKIWRVRFNEMQMLLHASSVNRLREQHHQPALNSLWFWGEGMVPEVVPSWQHIWTNEALGCGLAMKAKANFAAVPSKGEHLPLSKIEGQAVLVLEHALQAAQDDEPESWLRAMQQIDKDWFAPLLVALKQGKLNTLDVYPCDGRKLRITRRNLWRFWRRPIAFKQFI